MIYDPSDHPSVGPELDRFQGYFDEGLRSRVPLLDSILTYIGKQKGKQLRPMFVLLCANLGGRAALEVLVDYTTDRPY